jgi:hypothetical protein
MGRRRWVSLLIIATRRWGLWYWNIDYYWRWRHRQIEKQMNVLPDRKLRQSKINDGAHTPPLNSIKPKLRFSSFQRKVSTVCLSFHLYKSSFDYSLADGRGRPAR